MRIDLTHRVAIVTGGVGGIGAATARAMIEAGATVVLADVAAEGAAIAEQLGATFMRLDVTDEEDWRRVTADVERRHGTIDILVNGAGIEGDQRSNNPLTTTLKEWRRVHAVNLDGAFLGCQSVLPAMQRQQGGSIVNICSVASEFPMPFGVAYGSSKAALAHLTKSVAAFGSLEGGRIRCNSVHPGLIRTRMLYNIVAQKMPEPGDEVAAAESRAHTLVPLRNLTEPEDVAAQIVFLSSDFAKDITGGQFVIDGGWSLTVGGWMRR